MLINVFKKERVFSYTRLFFVFMGMIALLGIGMGVYMAQQAGQLQKNKTQSEEFFQTKDISKLKFHQVQSEYRKLYGNPTSTAVLKEQRQYVDTYLSADGTKAITLLYTMQTDETAEPRLEGYLITGYQESKREADAEVLKRALDQPVNTLLKEVGAGVKMDYDSEKGQTTLIYVINGVKYKVEIDQKAEKIIAVNPLK